MALKQKNILIVLLFAMSVVISFGVSFKVSLQNSITPNAPASEPKAASCKEHCPDTDGVLRSCNPPDSNGDPNESICSGKGRIEMCGGTNYCCPSANGTWTTDMSACCVDSTWTPNPNTVCVGTSLNQTSNCGRAKTAQGTKIDGVCVVCTDTTWTPAANLTCTGTSVTQTSNCGTTRSIAGTKTDGVCVVCTDTTWTPAVNLTCTGTNVTQTSNCGTTRSIAGTKTDTTWTPALDTVCAGASLSQSGDCGATRSVSGTKYCCTDTSWSPSSASICSESKLVQKSNCGNEKEIDGTKTCYPNISVMTGAYADDSRNKTGIYFTDKKITKVSRDQFYVYTMEVYNKGDGSAKDLVISDTLTGQNQSLIAFADGEDRCTYDSPTKKLSCKVDKLAAKSEIKLRFRVKTAATAINGKIIRNTVKVTDGNTTKSASVDLLVSSIVTCNEFCNNDSECVAGLACDVFSNKCRKPSCLNSTSCNCVLPTATVTTKITATPTDVVVDFPDSSAVVSSPTLRTTLAEIADETAPIEELPSTGIFDLPETTIFGGGILLAILGIFLAL